jgi:hypothetical protein
MSQFSVGDTKRGCFCCQRLIISRSRTKLILLISKIFAKIEEIRDLAPISL